MTDVSSDQQRRYLAVWFPLLPADRLRWDRLRRDCLRQRADRSCALDEAPVCFIEKRHSALRITAVNRAAGSLGLAPGLALADARARVPHLVAVDMDHDADRAWLERMADFCDRYTPLVALQCADGMTLDITGCAHLFGGETSMREDLLSRLSQAVSEVRTSIAGTPQAARALARFGAGGIVAPGRDANAVAPLPVAALETDYEIIIALRRSGLKTLGNLTALPRAALAARFGAGLPRYLARILGEENTGITPRRPLPPCIVEHCFAEPITRIDDALGTLEELALQTEQSLQNRAEGGQCFEASFFRSDGVVRRLSVDTARPVRAPQTLIRLFRERIDTLRDPLDPGYGYDLIRLSVFECVPFSTVQRSLDGREVEDDNVSELIDRLSIKFGKDAVVQFLKANTHVPERAARAIPAGQAVTPDAAAWPVLASDARPRRPIHLFDRPEPIEAMAEIPDGPPLKFRWRRVLHEVAHAEGPERIAPEWWRSDDTHPTRDYYCLEDAQGRRFWVFRDGLYLKEARHPRWFLHGLFA